MNKSLAADEGTLIATAHFKLLSSMADDEAATAASSCCWKPTKIIPHPTLSRLRTDRTWADISLMVQDGSGGRILNHTNVADFLLLADAIFLSIVKRGIFRRDCFCPLRSVEGWTTRVLQCERLVMEVI
jgi:hypothetical protein